MKIEIFYDKDCPICKLYTTYIKLKDTYDLVLINARENKQKIEDLKKKGFDINDGFIVKVPQKRIYQGSDAIIFLNTLTKKQVFFYNNFFFKNMIYPFIKHLRKLLLLLKNKNIKL